MPKRPHSIVWKYFAKLDGNFAECRACNRRFSYKTTTSNLKKHLRKRHKEFTDVDSPPCVVVFEKSEDLSPSSSPPQLHDTTQDDEQIHNEGKIELELHDMQEFIQPKKMKTQKYEPRYYSDMNRMSTREIESINILHSNSHNSTQDNILSNKDDDDEIFGKFLIVELKKLEDKKLKNRCKRDILSILMEYGTAQDDDGIPEETS